VSGLGLRAKEGGERLKVEGDGMVLGVVCWGLGFSVANLLKGVSEHEYNMQDISLEIGIACVRRERYKIAQITVLVCYELVTVFVHDLI
jgi:hypothetical protein